ncbi:MAG: Maf family protein [Bullifex sp.]
MLKRPETDPSLIRRLNAKLSKAVLASQSPNRRELLESLGLEVITRPQDINEMCGLTDPEEVVKTLSRLKMDSYLSSSLFDETLTAISLDTLVLFENRLLGKPQSEEEAAAFLKEFSGKTQLVLTGMSIYVPGHDIITISDTSEVVFEKLDDETVKRYLSTGEWRGAAGGYRIQKNGFRLVESIKGSWTNVIGFPLEAFVKTLEEL